MHRQRDWACNAQQAMATGVMVTVITTNAKNLGCMKSLIKGLSGGSRVAVAETEAARPSLAIGLGGLFSSLPQGLKLS